MSDQAETHWTSRKTEKNFNKAHRAKDLCILKVKEQVQFFHNKQGTGPIKWTTGTVTEILECGWSYMVQGPNGRVYRRNRAHLKPICHNSTSFQDHLVKKGKKQAKSRPSAQQGQIHVFPEGNQLYGHQIHVVWWTQHILNTPNITPIITPEVLLTQITVMLNPSIITIQRIICGAQFRGLLTQRQEETPVWTSFHLTLWHWPRTLTWTFSPVSWNVTISTLQNTVVGQGQGPREN